MPVRSVIDIELAGSEKFAKFQELFAKYEAALSKSPALWSKVGKAQAELAQNTTRMTAALLAQNTLHKEIADEESKQLIALNRSQRVWASIGHTAKSLASTVGHITLNLLKWGALLGGAGGAFSLYGIGRAIEGVTDSRRSAMGLGLSIGQQTSFGINFGRLLDTGQYLSWVAGAEQDVTKQAPFYSLLGHGLTGNTERDAMSMLMAMRRLARTTPLSLLGPEFSALGLQMSPEDRRRLASMGNSEFQRLVSGNRADIAKTNVPDSIAMGWQDFLTQMKLAGKQIEKTFVIGLAPLEGPLKRLSGSIVHVLEVALRKNGIIEEGIKHLAKWLDSFNGKIAKPQFLADVESFTSNVGVLADALKRIIDFARHPFKSTEQKILSYTRWAPWAENNNPGNLRFVGQAGATRGEGGFAKFSTMQQGLNAMARQLEAYRLRGIDTVQGIVSKYAPASDHNDTAAYIANVSKALNVSPSHHLDLGNARVLADLMRAMIRQEVGHTQTFGGGIASAAQIAPSVGVIVRVDPSTGANVHVSSAGLGAP